MCHKEQRKKLCYHICRRLFWIDSGSLSIQSSTMSGANVTVVVGHKPSSLLHPVGLCVDPNRQRLYWYNSEYRAISTSGYDGSDVVLFRSAAAHEIHVVNLEVYMVSWCSLGTAVNKADLSMYL